MAEIDDATLAQFQALQKLVADMQADPEARRQMDRAIKKVRPNVETEEDVAEKYRAPVMEELKAVRDDLAAHKAEIAKREQDWADGEENRRMHAAFADLRRTGGYTDDGVKEIADMMLKRKIADPYAAAALYDKQHPAAPEIQTSSYEPTSWKIGPDDDVKRWFTDANGMEADQIRAALNDVRAGAVQH